MIEVFIERWTRPDGTTEYRWSVWRDGLPKFKDWPTEWGGSGETLPE